jgi:hypothetical protein
LIPGAFSPTISDDLFPAMTRTGLDTFGRKCICSKSNGNINKIALHKSHLFQRSPIISASPSRPYASQLFVMVFPTIVLVYETEGEAGIATTTLDIYFFEEVNELEKGGVTPSVNFHLVI